MRLIFLCFFFCCSLVYSTPLDQITALQDLYYATNGDEWTHNSNWLQGDPCINFWYGVTCDRERINIIELDLKYNNLTGTIPDSFCGNLDYLTALWLPGNALPGTIPESLSNLTSLFQLYLYDNEFTGSIPASLATLPSLYYLFLNTNRLNGSIPDALGDSHSLSLVNFAFNELSGPIPNSFGNLPLFYLNCTHNQLDGTIPSSLGKLHNLQHLYLDQNNFQSPLPPFLQKEPQNMNLDLQNNAFSCPVPSWCGESGNFECLPCI